MERQMPQRTELVLRHLRDRWASIVCAYSGKLTAQNRVCRKILRTRARFRAVSLRVLPRRADPGYPGTRVPGYPGTMYGKKGLSEYPGTRG
eukprot:2262226-Rhodomonas_salina.1